MTAPAGGERHERAVEAARTAMTEQFYGPWPEHVDTTLRAYFASLAEQGVRLIEQPVCVECEGDGIARGRGGAKRDYECQFCGGLGYERMVALAEVAAELRKLHRDTRPYQCAEMLEKRFGGGER